MLLARIEVQIERVLTGILGEVVRQIETLEIRRTILEINEIQLIGNLVVDNVFHQQIVVRKHDRRIDRVEHLQHLLYFFFQTVDIRDAELTGRKKAERYGFVNGQFNRTKQPD